MSLDDRWQSSCVTKARPARQQDGCMRGCLAWDVGQGERYAWQAYRGGRGIKPQPPPLLSLPVGSRAACLVLFFRLICGTSLAFLGRGRRHVGIIVVLILFARPLSLMSIRFFLVLWAGVDIRQVY